MNECITHFDFQADCCMIRCEPGVSGGLLHDSWWTRRTVAWFVVNNVFERVRRCIIVLTQIHAVGQCSLFIKNSCHGEIPTVCKINGRRSSF